MRYLSLMFLLFFAAAAIAQSPYPDPMLGSRPGAFSARSLGAGHTFVTNETGPAALVGNPATMVYQESRWHFELSGDISRVREIRKYPYYDAFDGVLGYNNYALNDHLFSKLDGGVSYRGLLPAGKPFVVSVGSYSLYRFDYRYHEEVRDRYPFGGLQDRRLGENRLDIDGDLRTLSLGTAVRLHRLVAVGLGAHVYTGEWTYTRAVYYDESYLDPDSANIVDRTKYSTRGQPTELSMGFTVDASNRVRLGARALLPIQEFSFKLNDSYSTGTQTVESSGTVWQTYPSHYALGVQYRPQGEYRPVLMLEGEIHTYSDTSDELDDTFEIRAGAEQQIVPGAPVRIGFVYATAPDEADRVTTLFTAGIGFTLQKLRGDFGMEIGKINYSSADMFAQSLYEETDRTDNDRVETGLFRGMITLRYDL